MCTWPHWQAIKQGRGWKRIIFYLNFGLSQDFIVIWHLKHPPTKKSCSKGQKILFKSWESQINLYLLSKNIDLLKKKNMINRYVKIWFLYLRLIVLNLFINIQHLLSANLIKRIVMFKNNIKKQEKYWDTWPQEIIRMEVGEV